MRRIIFLMMMMLATMVADAQTALKKVYDESIDPMNRSTRLWLRLRHHKARSM